MYDTSTTILLSGGVPESLARLQLERSVVEDLDLSEHFEENNEGSI